MPKEKNDKPSKEEKSVLKAKKDFVINHGDYFRKIKKGDDVSDVPKLYHPNLKTEGVL